MLKILKLCRTLFSEKVFGKECLIYNNRLYGLHSDLSIELECNIPFNCYVSIDLLIQVFEKLKGEYSAVFENNVITFTEHSTGLIYTIEQVRPVEILPILPTFDPSATFKQNPLVIFKTLAKESEHYIKTSGDVLMCDSVLVADNYVTFTDKKVIVAGVEDFGKEVSFALGVKQVRYLNKFIKYEIKEYLITDEVLIIIYENGLKLFLPITTSGVIERNVGKMKKVMLHHGSTDWITLPDFKAIKINSLLLRSLDFIRLSNETIESKDFKINFSEYDEINFDKIFSMKVPINCFKLLITLSNHISVKNNVVSFINNSSTIFGMVSLIKDD